MKMPVFGMLLAKFSQFENCLVPDAEDRYRSHFLRSDVAQAILGMIIILLTAVSYNVYQYEGQISWIPLLRWGFMIVSIILMVLFRFVTKPGLFDWLVLVWSLLLIATNTAGQVLYPQIYQRNFLIDVIVILALYMIVPNRLGFRLISGLSMSAVGIYLILNNSHMSLTALDAVAICMFYLLANGSGIIMSMRMYRQRRKEFISLENERILRKQISEMAENDELTRIFNRRKLIELAEKQFDLLKRYHRPTTFMFVDIDHFKSINDTYGHQAGDAVLRHFADLVKAQLRRDDVIGRLGGEEFGILLVETSIAEAIPVAERIRAMVAAGSMACQADCIKITVSIGVSEMSDDDVSLDDVISRADNALYNAKNLGRNRVERSA